MIDETLILRKLSELDTYRKQIEEYQGIPVAEYEADWKTQRIVERTLHLMIELCAHIGNHIISEQELQVPKSYADIFEILSQSGMISNELAATMVRMAKFRNIVVHQYTEVDATIVVEILNSHIDDFIDFKKEIIHHLEQ